jgi:hypothetical protein
MGLDKKDMKRENRRWNWGQKIEAWLIGIEVWSTGWQHDKGQRIVCVCGETPCVPVSDKPLEETVLHWVPEAEYFLTSPTDSGLSVIRCAMHFHSTQMGFSLTCLIVSKRFVNEIIDWLDYQSNISKILIIESLDNQAQVSV